jgi:ABC-2 type transport system permease protein
MNTTVAWLTWRQLFAGRRLWVVLILGLAPSLIAIMFRTTGADASRITETLTTLFKDVVVGTVLPLVALVFGTNAFAGEVDDGTLLYLLVKPVARWRIVITKFAVAAAATIVVLVPALVLPRLIIGGAPDIPEQFLVSYVVAGSVAAVLYVAGFLALGVATRRAVMIGLLYVIGFEQVLTRSIVGFRVLSVREFASTIAESFRPVAAVAAAAPAPALGRGSPLGGALLTPGPVSMDTVMIVGGLILVIGLGYALWMLVRYEVAERL